MESRPKRCCHPNCQECPYVDCRWDGYDGYEQTISNRIDQVARQQEANYNRNHRTEIMRRYQRTEKGREAEQRYKCTEKYRQKEQRYNSSPAGKERQNRYKKSKKGQEVARRKAKRKIDTGKNAEYCRRYYYRQKALQEA